MTHVDLGITGAKRQSWREANPRELLRRLAEKFPHDDDDDLFGRFRKELARASDAMNEAVERYWFDNNIRSLRPRPPRIERSAVERREKLIKSIENSVQQRIEEESERRFLDMVMPNSKLLRDCTGRECRSMGGWLAGIGDKLKSAELVGDKFSEEQVRSHWRRKYAEAPGN